MNLKMHITGDQAGLRLDQLICQSMADVSRSRAAVLVSQGSVQVNGSRKRPGYRVRTGDLVSGLILSETPERRPLAQDIPLSILYEDDFLMVLDKPAGLVVHPGAGHVSGTLVNGLLAHDPVFGAPHWDPLRPGIVHRLDKDTSGLILVAKTEKSHAFLQKEFKQRRVKKEYLALVRADGMPDEGVIELPVGRHPRDRKRMAVVHEGGRYAKTGFRVRRRFVSGALVAVRLYTGRTHQIRVHFYHQGMPLFGDRVYQVRRHRKGDKLAPRQMLHSWRLGFRHPYSGLSMAFEALVPEDFTTLMTALAEPRGL